MFQSVSYGFNSVGKPLKYHSARAAGCGEVVSGDLLSASLRSSIAESGNNSFDTYRGSPVYNSAVDGISGVYIPENSSLRLHKPFSVIPDNFTISFWVRPQASGKACLFFALGKDGRNSMIGVGASSGSSYAHLEFGSGGLSEVAVSVFGSWHHFTVVKKGSEYLFYIDGVLGAQGTNSNVTISYPYFMISGLVENSHDQLVYPTAGYFSCLNIYSRALSEASIKKLASQLTASS